MKAATIGSNYENALASLEVPGSEFYVPIPSSAMSCDAVGANMHLLDNFIQVWNGRLYSAQHTLITSKETISNCQKILYSLTSKLGAYQVLKSACDIAALTPAPTPGTPAPAPAQSKTGLWVLLGLGAAGIYLYKKRNHKTR
jgi:hypothetical protein